MQKKYRALRVVSLVYRIIAALIFLGALIGGGLTAVNPSIQYDLYSNTFTSAPPATGAGLAIIAAGVITALGLYAFGELLSLLVDLEANTRATNALLNRLTRQQKQKPDEFDL